MLHLRPPGVPSIEPPRHEGEVRVDKRRVLGFAEFGAPDGRLVLWFHGTPGARRQIPPVGRHAAFAMGYRLVCVERPGIGRSTDHQYPDMRAWADDIAVVADHFEAGEFAVVGLSGGGPYALACAHELPDRVTVAAILGGVVPTDGPAALGGGLVGLAKPWNTVLGAVQWPLGTLTWGLLRTLLPVAHPTYQWFSGKMPEGDRVVFADPGIEAMFIDDLVLASRRSFRALWHDVVLFGRPWGFELDDIDVPVRWWHGDADNFVSLAHAEHAVAHLQDVELYVRPGESHLGGFAAADDVLRVISDIW